MPTGDVLSAGGGITTRLGISGELDAQSRVVWEFRGGATMADAGWGHGRPAETDTGILNVLLSYATQGGQVFGARRWPDNPLTLTHVRWQSPVGAMVEAIRAPGNDHAIDDGESKIWVQLALHYPSTHLGASGPDAPWLPLTISREQATEWVGVLRQSRSRRSPSFSGTPMPGGMSRSVPGASVPESRYGESYGYGNGHGNGAGTTGGRGSTPYPSHLVNSASVPRSVSDTEQWSQGFHRNHVEASEVSILPCVEIELPPQIAGLDAAEYRRDFASDAARHFGRAVRGIAQVREVRGWIRGDRLVLGARIVVGMGMRQPTRAEMEGAAQMLAEVLSERTLPYSRLGFADPGEWTQGAPLPE